MRRDLGSFQVRVHGPLLAVDHVVVDSVLDVRRPIGNAKNALGIGFVLREQERNVSLAIEVPFSESGINRLDNATSRGRQGPVADSGDPGSHARTTGSGTTTSAKRAVLLAPDRDCEW